MFDFSIITTWFDNLLRQTLGLGDFWSILIECVLVGLLIIVGYALLAIVLIFMERKVCAYFQCRLGPMRVGPWGLLQVFADVLKMLIKEIFTVDKADKLLYFLSLQRWRPPMRGTCCNSDAPRCVPTKHHHSKKRYKYHRNITRKTTGKNHNMAIPSWLIGQRWYHTNSLLIRMMPLL